MPTSNDTHVAAPNGAATTQSRLVAWHDPMATQAAVASMPGLAYWRGVAEGQLPPPPIGQLMRMSMIDVGHGTITFGLTPDASMYNPLGMVHGGVVCTLLDTVAGCALHTTLAAGVGYTSVEIKVSYLRQITLASGELTATGTVIKAGSRIGFTEAKVSDGAGRLVATATSTLLVFGSPSAAK